MVIEQADESLSSLRCALHAATPPPFLCCLYGPMSLLSRVSSTPPVLDAGRLPAVPLGEHSPIVARCLGNILLNTVHCQLFFSPYYLAAIPCPIVLPPSLQSLPTVDLYLATRSLLSPSIPFTNQTYPVSMRTGYLPSPSPLWPSLTPLTTSSKSPILPL